MSNVEKILWYIELELDNALNLQRIAQHCHLSPFALARLFNMKTGWSVMSYVRARRLSRAAIALSAGASEILPLALAAGYGSHEAFTRAFTDQFGIPPKVLRQGRTDLSLTLVEPLRMKDTHAIERIEPRLQTRPGFIIAGLGDRFTFEKNEGIVALWQAFAPYLGTLRGQVGNVTYGLCCHPQDDGSFDYIAGVEVSQSQALPAGFTHVHIAPQQYAVFQHPGHVSTIHQTFSMIFNDWLPGSGYQAATAPEFEQYSADFNPRENRGLVEIWLPVQAR